MDFVLVLALFYGTGVRNSVITAAASPTAALCWERSREWKDWADKWADREAARGLRPYFIYTCRPRHVGEQVFLARVTNTWSNP